MSAEDAPMSEHSPAEAAEQEAGWVKRLMCDLLDSSILSLLRVGVASHSGNAAEFLAMMLAESVRSAHTSHSTPPAIGIDRDPHARGQCALSSPTHAVLD
jgi:hypothetical protein